MWAVGAVLAYLSLRTVRVDADDVFYVNKAVYVAETGRIPLRDTIYSDQVLPALRGAGTASLQSIEVLQGAVAHLLGISAGTVVYLVTPPVMSFLAVWAVWRLARSWSVVRALVAFAVATTYLLWGVKSGYGLGAFWIGRIWQGKVIFVCLAVPLLYLALTRWARLGRRYDAAMLFAVGAVALGLTSTATLVVPPIAAGAAVMLLLCRRPRWYVPLLAAAYPVASGVVVALAAAGGGQFGNVAFTSFEAFHAVVGDRLWGALGVVGLLLAPWAVRAGAARMTAAAGSVVAVAAMAPGVPQLVNTVTGAGPILYRLMWMAVLPVLVGVLATAPLPVDRFAPAVRRTVAVAVPAALAALLVVGGQLGGRGHHPAGRPALEVPDPAAVGGRVGGRALRRARPGARTLAADARPGADDDRGPRRRPTCVLPLRHRRAGGGARGQGAAQPVDAQREHLTAAEAGGRPGRGGGGARLPRRAQGEIHPSGARPRLAAGARRGPGSPASPRAAEPASLSAASRRGASCGHSILGQVSMTTSSPAARARSAAASSTTPSCIQMASICRRSLLRMASSTTAPTRSLLTKQSTTLMSWSGMSSIEA